MENGSNNENKLQHIDSEDQLRNALTKSMTLSPELYEKVFLAPKNQVSGDLRKTFANPTPIAIMGFVVALLPLSIEFSTCRQHHESFKANNRLSGLERKWRDLWNAEHDLFDLLWRSLTYSRWCGRVHSGQHFPLRSILRLWVTLSLEILSHPQADFTPVRISSLSPPLSCPFTEQYPGTPWRHLVILTVLVQHLQPGSVSTRSPWPYCPSSS